MHALKVEPSKLHANEEFASVAVKLKLAEVRFVKAEGLEVIVVSGAVLSMVALTPPEVAELFEVSTAEAVIVTEPSPRVVEFQVML